jgi:FSR family fosmidomycin resistance protein-like MFS transporter
VLAGGVLFTSALVAVALAPTFGVLLAALAVLYPASGAFVALSQADLMDADTTRREQNMARWNLAGSLGALAGPGLLIAAVLVAVGWRGAYVAMAVAAAIALGSLALTRSSRASDAAPAAGFGQAMRAAVRSLARREVLRNLLLLEVSDLMLDVLTGYLALYFVDVLGEPVWVGALVVAVRIASGLIGDFITIHILERVAGLAYVRATAAAALVAYPLFLVVPGLVPKLVVLALVSLLTAGWYPVLQARLYEALPGQSGAQLAIGNVFRVAATPIPLLIGLAAATFGLGGALWIFAVSPLLLSILLLRGRGQATA